MNVGGGIGVPARDDERAVDIDAYAAVLARHLGPLGVAVGAEPGDYLSKDAAILLGEVVTVEERGGVTFVGLDLGWNLNCAYFIYGYLQEILPVAAVDSPGPRSSTSPGTSTRPATCSPRTTRWRRSPRATSWPCSTRAVISRR